MEQKNVLLSALSVGLGVGVGLGLASGQTVGRWVGGGSCPAGVVTAEKIEQELMRQIIDGRESSVKFDEFPYYLRWWPCFEIFFFLVLPSYNLVSETARCGFHGWDVNLAPSTGSILFIELVRDLSQPDQELLNPPLLKSNSVKNAKRFNLISVACSSSLFGSSMVV